MRTVMFVNHKEKNCGVYQYGRIIGDILTKSQKYQFVYAECSNNDDLKAKIQKYYPQAIIYNYHPSTLGWLSKVTKTINIPQIGMIHEITQDVADRADKTLFDYHIAPDPTLLLRNPIVFKTGRPIPQYDNNVLPPTNLTIGSFGFGHKTKGFHKIVELVQQEFDLALIRLQITTPHGNSISGEQEYERIVNECKSKIYKKGITTETSNEFLEPQGLLDFLAGNTVNVFLYDDQQNRGLSSVIDYALAVRRTIAISNSSMFRHLFPANPSICISHNSLSNIIANGIEPLKKYYSEWSNANLIWEYERIVDTVSRDFIPVKRRKLNIFERVINKHYKARFGKRLIKVPKYAYKVSWNATSTYHAIEFNNQSGKMLQQYMPVKGINNFNIILDDVARRTYDVAVRLLGELCPDLIKRKMPRANIQQGFVLDTVYRFAKELHNPKILCVGCYEDTAAYALAKLGINFDAIDPMINFNLQDFLDRPTTLKGHYDIIFSTSVIEHVDDDEQFVKDIAVLLNSNGVAVLTCDFQDTYKLGDEIPEVCERFYTKYDLENRLMNVMPYCKLIGKPNWDCDNYDFVFDKYRYTFATFVFRKAM
ncbi:methyltransferase domain-containing protein [bacterium]|nr:methyltransferase domain-containing protein [bacterium]